MCNAFLKLTIGPKNYWRFSVNRESQLLILEETEQSQKQQKLQSLMIEYIENLKKIILKKRYYQEGFEGVNIM